MIFQRITMWLILNIILQENENINIYKYYNDLDILLKIKNKVSKKG